MAKTIFVQKTKALEILAELLRKIKLLRKELVFLFPLEDLGGYANPDKIRKSYRSAVEKYPPFPSWK